MALKFSVNLNTMYQEFAFQDRFNEAINDGFSACEMQNPYELAPHIIKENLNGMKVDLVNMYSGPSRYGCAAMPVHEGEFFDAIQFVKPYSFALNFKKLHIMSGLKADEKKFSIEDQVNTFTNNLRSLLNDDFLENIGVTAVIEPICNETINGYFLNSYDLAIEIIKAVNSSQVKLLLDVFHLHKITGEVEKNLEKYYPYAGHIQISQSPGRREPFFDGGEINFHVVFDFLRKKNHQDYIGLEYFPSGSTSNSIKWIKDL